MNRKAYLMETLLNGEFSGPSQQSITSVVYDSRDVEEGAAFVWIAGEKMDGHLFIEQAIELGAKTIVGTDHEKMATASALYREVSFLYVHDSRQALADLARVIYDFPSESLHTIGVTGTNGKTTVSSFTYNLL
ncbi:Mur ligase domain-containing protein, partial [Micrococcus sp. SIMBA_131]